MIIICIINNSTEDFSVHIILFWGPVQCLLYLRSRIVSVMCLYRLQLTCLSKDDCNASCFSCESAAVVLGMMGDLHKNKDAVLINPVTNEYPQ